MPLDHRIGSDWIEQRRDRGGVAGKLGFENSLDQAIGLWINGNVIVERSQRSFSTIGKAAVQSCRALAADLFLGSNSVVTHQDTIQVEITVGLLLGLVAKLNRETRSFGKTAILGGARVDRGLRHKEFESVEDRRHVCTE